MPFPEWSNEVFLRLNGMGYEEAPLPSHDPRWRWLIREEPLLRRIFIIADETVQLEEIQDIIKKAISQWRKAEQPIRIGIVADGHIRELVILSDISWVGALWSIQDKGIRLLYQDGRWDVEDHLLRRRITMQTDDDEKEMSPGEEASARPILSYLLLTVNVILFITATLLGGSDQPKILLLLGAKDAPKIWMEEYWRLFTPIFYHVGYGHFFLNSFVLFLFGPLLERLLGKWRFILIYILSGFIGVLTAMVTLPYYQTAGASGATFGLLGAWTYCLLRKPKMAWAGLNRIIFVMYGLMFVFGFWIWRSNIGYWTQIAGFFGGFALLAGVGLGKGKGEWTAQHKICLSLLGAAIIILGITALYPPPSGWYFPFDRGRQAMFEHDDDIAIDQLGLSLKRREANPITRIYLADVYRSRGEKRFYKEDYNGALEDFHAGNALKESYLLHYYLAKTYYQLERPEDALQELQRAADLEPGNEQIQKDIENLKRQMH